MKLMHNLLITLSFTFLFHFHLIGMLPGGAFAQKERELISKMRYLYTELQIIENDITTIRKDGKNVPNELTQKIDNILLEARRLNNRQNEFMVKTEASQKRLAEFHNFFADIEKHYRKTRGGEELDEKIKKLDELLIQAQKEYDKFSSIEVFFGNDVFPAIKAANESVIRAVGIEDIPDIAREDFEQTIQEKEANIRSILMPQIEKLWPNGKKEMEQLIDHLIFETQLTLAKRFETSIERFKKFAPQLKGEIEALQNRLDQKILSLIPPIQEKQRNYSMEFLDSLKTLIGSNERESGKLRAINIAINNDLLKKIPNEENQKRLKKELIKRNKEFDEILTSASDFLAGTELVRVKLIHYKKEDIPINAFYMSDLYKITVEQLKNLYEALNALYQLQDKFSNVIQKLNFVSREQTNPAQFYIKNIYDPITENKKTLFGILQNLQVALEKLKTLPPDAHPLVKDIVNGMIVIAYSQFPQPLARERERGILGRIAVMFRDTLGLAEARILYSLQAILDPDFTPRGWENLQFKNPGVEAAPEEGQA